MGFKEMDIKVLRIIIISALVLFFVFCLILLKIEGEKLGGDTTPPLLKLMKKPSIYRIKADNVGELNKYLGSFVEILGKVERVKRKNEGFYILVGKVWIVVDQKNKQRFSKVGLSVEDLRGMTVKVKGKLKVNSDLGFVLFPEGLVEIVSGKKGF